jgi:16S rRNA (guanine527-N7)-methyltransferase
MTDPARLAADRRQALALCPVSRETEERLGILVDELRRWQNIKNLVGPVTLERLWTRHVADSLQLLDFAPNARIWLDLGSGAGFPGLAIAVAIPERVTDGAVHLVESNGRKCAFLRHVARLTDAPAVVHEGRIESVVPQLAGGIEVVTARALAPLPQLLAWSSALLTTGAMGLFPKGQDVNRELTEAAKSWTYAADLLPSRTDSHGRIVRIRSLAAR